MMPSQDDFANRELIESLVGELQQGSISPSDKARLDALLLESREGRQLFLQYAHLEAGLHWLYAARQQVATVIDGTPPGGLRPTADIAQQQLRFGDDPRFTQVMNACAANEAHCQEWLQIFPRVLAVASLCTVRGASARGPVQAVVDKLLADYSPEMPASALWAAADSATRDVLKDQAAAAEEAFQDAEAVLACAFSAAGDHSILDAISIFEVLDDCVPHRLPADALRVLCLRYINGLPVNRIALHLNRSPQHVQAQLAKVRVHLVSHCLAAAGADPKQVNVRALLRSSTLFELPAHRSLVERVHAAGANDGPVDPTHLLLLAIVHDYLSRQLSATRLLEEVALQKNKSYQLAVEQSIRDIEALGTPQLEPAKAPSNSRRTPYVAALLGIAAGLLIAVGIAMLAGSPNKSAPVPASDELANAQDAAPSAPPAGDAVTDAAPAVIPVVAVVSEAIGLSSPASDRLAVGSEVRRADLIAFEHGVAELTTTSGCTLVLEGPVDATIVDHNRVLLRRGKIAGLNDQAGESLVIDSPKTSIVDVGTEFGVGVGESGETTVAVYEGEVRLEPLDASPALEDGRSVALAAGWETRIEASADAPAKAVPLTHDRAFVRADEVQLRKEAASGNPDSAARVAYFALLRAKGLLAYQGFHDAVAGGEFALGFRSPPVRSAGDVTFVPNIVDGPGLLGPSQSVSMGKDALCYLDIDVGPQSRLARAGLVDENGKIGNRPGELWVCWRSKAVGPPGTTFSWAGLSLMFGDSRSTEEPLFVGKVAPLSNFGFHTYPGAGAPREAVVTLDQDSAEPGEQPRLPDFQEHLWLVRLRMNGATADVAVWCDAQPDDVAALPPEATQTIQEFRFDRLRLEAHPDGENGSWLFDDVIIASSSEAIAETLRVISQQAEPVER